MFGMGTGGSLRLLSPEIWGCQGGRSASARPFGRTPLRAFPGRAAAFALAPARFRFPCLAPSKPHRSLRFAPPDHGLATLRFDIPASLLTNPFRVRLRSLVPFQPSALAFAPPSGFSCSLFPFPCPLSSLQDQALDRLVSPSSIRYRTSTDDLSTLSSSRGLTHF